MPSAATERGASLCEIGLSEQAVLRLGQTTRQFLLTRLENNLITPALETIDAYHHAVVQGFMQSREKVILNEQERIRSALQRTLSRYTVQMEVAAGVAGATTSILDLSALLQTAVELIRERFDLYYVGIFLVDEDNRWALLKAGTGESGREMLRHGFKLEVGGNSLIGACIAYGESRIALDVGKAAARFENPLLPDTNSEAAIPLVSRGQVIGALTVQSRRVAAFSELDLTILRILADQLANAIENARLFSELRHSEEKYRTILENIEEGYYEMDLAGSFTFVNDAMGNTLGYPKDEIQGVNYQQFIDPEHIEKMSQAFQTVYRTGEPARGVEYRIVRKDETGRFIETSASLVRDASGQPIGLRGIVRDITRRKQAEQFLIERKALERSNRELEQFAYVASHDLQEPLRKIQTFSGRLKSKYGASLSDEGRDYLERMLNASSRMQNLINDLLTLSRVATKAQPFLPVHLAQVTYEVLSDLEARIEQTGGRVEVDELPTIDADPIQMRQLLQNLIGNGLKFHRPDEPPVIKVYGRLIRERRVTRNLGSDVLCQIMVEDNGIGFDEKYLGRIFQPFQRLHGRTEYEGTGIGLTICQRIVERHGGHITAQSALNQGATFIVTLPARQAKAEDMP
jgi:PAS domain S-box-containing protein